MTWSLAFLIILPQAFSTNGFFLEGFQVSCTFDYFSRDFRSRMLLFYMVICGFIIPIAIICTAYVKIYSTVQSITSYSREKLQQCESYKSNVSFSDTHFGNNFPIKYSDRLQTLNHNKSHFKTATESLSLYTAETSLTYDMSTNRVHQRWAERRNAIKIDSDLIKMNHLFRRRNGLKTMNELMDVKPKDILLEREVKVAKMVLIKIVLFCAAWTPYVIVILLTQFGSNIKGTY